MKFCKEYRQYMQGKEETLPVLGFKKLKKVMKKCRRDFRCKKNIDGLHNSQTCPDHCPGKSKKELQMFVDILVV